MSRVSRVESQARTREALLVAGERVFVERGLQGASVERIAAAAGFTRGAFYSNFASKEELFAELLQQRVYERYREMTESQLSGETHDTPRRIGERLAAFQADPRGRWLFRLWFELLAHAGRDERMRELAAGFWSGNRALLARLVTRQYEDAGTVPPIPPEQLASAIIALDVGLAVQHHVDPAGMPLDTYPAVFETLFGKPAG